MVHLSRLYAVLGYYCTLLHYCLLLDDATGGAGGSDERIRDKMASLQGGYSRYPPCGRFETLTSNFVSCQCKAAQRRA
jgi:hypothetical protein